MRARRLAPGRPRKRAPRGRRRSERKAHRSAAITNRRHGFCRRLAGLIVHRLPPPIHDLLAKRGACIVFHGHDHLYVRAERDGVVYQEVPQPGHGRGTTRSAEEYSYKSGVILPSSGILRARVTPGEAAVDYVKADAAGTVAHRYTVTGRAGDGR